MLCWKVALCALLGGIMAFCRVQENTCPDVLLFDLGLENRVVFLQGCPGVDGPQGPPGAPGHEGVQGPTGLTGAPGVFGPPGEDGISGLSGLPGGAGQKGDAGFIGQAGAPGITGDRGDCSIDEPAGLSGPRNCLDVLRRGLALTGWYTIYPDGKKPLTVLCDMETDGGGWIVLQKRNDGSLDFFRDWKSYKKGFGHQKGEFWLGNDNIRRLTATGSFTLRVDVEDFEGNFTYATYSKFYIEEESDKYTLRYGSFAGGTAGDSLELQRNHPFSTKDQKNDQSAGDLESCAQYFKGGWWFEACHLSHLNGEYLKGPQKTKGVGIIWHSFRGSFYSLKSSQLKFRPEELDQFPT
uniref:Fibrinogen C-terminal domain-containing protein n=1 Tax=Leptobrachium leishanense TaxID=445787 RepID=A0A8C5RAW7_9ANUR